MRRNLSTHRLYIKAEFDSALADFNARLTTFEAGINSKIDSQVSSYLDRNGIWNGKSVFFMAGDAIKVSADLQEALYKYEVSSGSSTIGVAQKGLGGGSSVSITVYGSLIKNMSFPQKNILTASKSGLLYLPLYFRSMWSGNHDIKTKNDALHWPVPAGVYNGTVTCEKLLTTNKAGGSVSYYAPSVGANNASWGGAYSAPGITPLLNFKCSDGTLLTTYSPYSLSYTVVGSEYGSGYLQPSSAENSAPYSTVLLCFVDKDKTYCFSFELVLSGRGSDTLSIVNTSSNAVAMVSVVGVKNAKIY